MRKQLILALATTALFPTTLSTDSTQSKSHAQASDQVIAEQRDTLANNTKGKGFGPQSPRDIDSITAHLARYPLMQK